MFLVPSAAVFGAFIYYPLIVTIREGFYRSDPFGRGSEWVGFDQYLDVLGSSEFHNSLWVTGWFALLTVPAGLALGLALALLAHQRLRGIAVFRTIFSSTVASSVAAAAVIWLVLLDPHVGVVNWLLELVGLGPIRWLQEPRWALVGVSLTTIWANLSFSFIVMTAGLQAIPDELIDAARVDGAGPFRRLTRVTLPLLSPTLFFSLVVTTILAFQSFGQIDLLTQGGPVDSTNVIVYSIYKTRFDNFDVGSASAQAVFLLLITLAFTAVQFRFLERRVSYAAK